MKRIKKHIKKYANSKSDMILVLFSYIFLIILAFLTLYPFWDLLIMSISPRSEALKTGWRFFTKNPNITAYRQILDSAEVLQSFYNSVVRVILGTLISVFLIALIAYPLSKRDFPLNRLFTTMIIFTMLFSGGLIPTYLWIKRLGLTNSIFALILPSAVNAYNVIIMRNFLRSIPESMEESARIDGATDFIIWSRIILPLSMPVISTVSLWVAVGHWNAYFDALIYITDRSKYVLQIVLRRVLLEDQIDMYMQGPEMYNPNIKPTAETAKAALIMISTLPIIIVYPFLQKYFVKGIMLGSVKG